METVNFLAQLWGFSLIAIPLVLLFKTEYVEDIIQVVEDRKSAILLGMVTLVVGIASLLSYNVWGGWKTIITILGWLIIVKGLGLLFLPGIIRAKAAAMRAHKDWMPIILLVCVIAGCVLVYLGNIYA